MKQQNRKTAYQSPAIIMFCMAPFCQDNKTLPIYNGSKDPTLPDPSASDAREVWLGEDEDDTQQQPSGVRNIWED